MPNITAATMKTSFILSIFILFFNPIWSQSKMEFGKRVSFLGAQSVSKNGETNGYVVQSMDYKDDFVKLEVYNTEMKIKSDFTLNMKEYGIKGYLLAKTVVNNNHIALLFTSMKTNQNKKNIKTLLIIQDLNGNVTYKGKREDQINDIYASLNGFITLTNRKLRVYKNTYKSIFTKKINFNGKEEFSFLLDDERPQIQSNEIIGYVKHFESEDYLSFAYKKYKIGYGKNFKASLQLVTVNKANGKMLNDKTLIDQDEAAHVFDVKEHKFIVEGNYLYNYHMKTSTLKFFEFDGKKYNQFNSTKVKFEDLSKKTSINDGQINSTWQQNNVLEHFKMSPEYLHLIFQRKDYLKKGIFNYDKSIHGYYYIRIKRDSGEIELETLVNSQKFLTSLYDKSLVKFDVLDGIPFIYFVEKQKGQLVLVTALLNEEDGQVSEIDLEYHYHDAKEYLGSKIGDDVLKFRLVRIGKNTLLFYYYYLIEDGVFMETYKIIDDEMLKEAKAIENQEIAPLPKLKQTNNLLKKQLANIKKQIELMNIKEASEDELLEMSEEELSKQLKLIELLGKLKELKEKL